MLMVRVLLESYILLISFEDDEFEDAGGGTAPSLIVDAFEEIADSITKGGKIGSVQKMYSIKI
ncbi:hypothetical protein Hanom_Chr13g01214481 [Helianthus anomalus]